MKKSLVLFPIVLTILLICSCSRGSFFPDKETSIKTLPENFNILSKNEEYNLPDINGMNTVLLESLNEIGVNSISLKKFGNYYKTGDLRNVDAFIVTDTDKRLIAYLTYFDFSSGAEWKCSFIKDADNYDITYYAPGITEVVDLYDYQSGELISKATMTYDEFNEKLKNDVEESDRKFKEDLNGSLEKYGFGEYVIK